MAIETKDQYFERIIAKPKPKCKHCGEEMSLWEVPPINFSDGLGWGVPYLYVCFNDECSLYKQGWDHLQENYAQAASYRAICYPDSDSFECMPVFGPTGGHGQVVDDEVVAMEEALKENIKRGFSVLAHCYSEKDMVPALRMLLDPTEPARVRLKAAEMIGDLGELEAIDALSNLKVGNEILQKTIDEAVTKIHERYFTRECPFCAEVIKKRAKVCKHCGKEVAGQ